jgi:ribose transport system permease protein
MSHELLKGKNLKEYFSILFVRAGVLPWFLGIALITFTFASNNFLTPTNLAAIARHSTDLILVAMAQMIVMLTAGLDFSVGVILAMTSVVASMTMVALWSGYGNGWEAIAIGCLTGLFVAACIGLVNGCVFSCSSFYNDTRHVFYYFWLSPDYYWRYTDIWCS